MTLVNIEDMDNDKEYFALKALSASQIKTYNEDEGPYRFWKKSVFNPNREEDNLESDALVFGKLAHCMLLEFEEVEKRYLIADWGTKSRNTVKYKDFAAAHPDKIIVSKEEYQRAGKMLANIRSHKLANSIITGATTELPIVWRDDETGLLMKCKVDALKRTKNGIVVIDYKTSSDVAGFIKWPHKLSYYLQDVVYRQAIKEKYGEEATDFIFIMQSSKEGEEDLIAILRYSLEDVLYAQDKARWIINDIALKIKAWGATHDDSIWTPYPNVIDLHLPQWIINQQAEI